MAFTLKPADLENAAKAADVQKKTKADLKSSVGKKNVKFIAAKNAVIGGKTVSLFIVTDNPTPFEAILKAKHPKAYRAKGTCDIEKDKASGQTRVTIQTAAGQLLPDAVAKLVAVAVGSDKNVVAAPAKAPQGLPLKDIEDQPKLKRTVKFDESGVAKWAREDYREEAQRTVIASMTPDGKIGSVYFGDEGRIRTTHASGPTRSRHDEEKIIQFNINQKLAREEFKKENPNSTDPKDYPRWLSKKLVNVRVDNAPAWASKVEGPDTAHDLSQGEISPDTKLFEIFKRVSDDTVKGWHPSRGAATKFVTDKQTISVLEAAIKHIDGRGLTDPGERNREFYAFVKSRLPNFVDFMRDPSTIKTKTTTPKTGTTQTK